MLHEADRCWKNGNMKSSHLEPSTKRGYDTEKSKEVFMGGFEEEKGDGEKWHNIITSKLKDLIVDTFLNSLIK